MNLKEFIESALIDIVEGIRASQESPLGGLVAPDQTGGHSFAIGKGVSDTGRITSTIAEFDVAVVVEEQNKTTGAVKAGIKVFSAGVNGEIADHKSTTTRIKFSVPIVLPKNAKKWHEA